MKVYKMIPDVERFQSLAFREPPEGLLFDGDSYSENWKPPRVIIRNPSKPAPDFWGLEGIPAFALKWSLQGLSHLMGPGGEMLKLAPLAKKLYLFNIIYVLNCLDKKASIRNAQSPQVIERYAFHRNRIDRGIFKLTDDGGINMYATEGLCASPDDEFLPTVKKRKLKGLLFEKVWSSE